MSFTTSAPLEEPRAVENPAELLQYLSDYAVAVCTSCHYAIQPNAISRHLKEIHRIQRSRRHPYMQYVSRLRLDQPQTVIQSKILVFPVPLLPIVGGLQCNQKGCFHLCASIKRMRTHWLSAHGRSGQAIVDWHSVPLQTFFRGNLLRYFTAAAAHRSWNHHAFEDSCEGRSACKEDNPGTTPHVQLLPSTQEPQQNSILNELDRAILQHYIKSTCLTIAHNAETQNLWQIVVPELTDQHPFLLHGILACTALHLAYSNPAQQQQYAIIAGNHQDRAMPIFREEISRVSSSNCDAVYVFAHLLVIYSFASEILDDRLLLVEGNSPDALPSWLYFLRTGCAMVCEVWDHLTTGPVKELASVWEEFPEVSENCESYLVEYFLSVVPPQTSDEAWPKSQCQLIHDAAVELSFAFFCTKSLGPELHTWDTLRVWPMRISEEFLNLLRSGHPGALILYAHYCIILKKLEWNWYFEGRASRLLSTVLRRLDVQWHGYVKWPLQEIGGCSSMDQLQDPLDC